MIGRSPFCERPEPSTRCHLGPAIPIAIAAGASLLGSMLNRPQEPRTFRFMETQKFLPFALRNRFTKDILQSGIQGIGELIRNPGGLSSGVSAAIAPRLAMESESIAQNFRGIQAEQAGSAARTNLPVSIKTALESALNVSQERAQRAARQGALVESEALRREDLSHVFEILNSILQFTQSGKNQAISNAGITAQNQASSQATMMSLIGSLLSSFSQPGAFGGGGGTAVPTTASTGRGTMGL